MSELLQIGPAPVRSQPEGTRRRIPEWLTIKAPTQRGIGEVQELMRANKLVTVCEEARCPNLTECWSKRPPRL